MVLTPAPACNCPCAGGVGLGLASCGGARGLGDLRTCGVDCRCRSMGNGRSLLDNIRFLITQQQISGQDELTVVGFMVDV